MEEKARSADQTEGNNDYADEIHNPSRQSKKKTGKREFDVSNGQPKGHKFYYIDDKLSEQLKSGKTEFSLLKLFGSSDDKKNTPPKYVLQKMITADKEMQEGAVVISDFIDDITYSKTSEDNVTCLKKEPFFFEENDRRFVGALEFLTKCDDQYQTNYNTLRKQIKCVVRNKLKKMSAKGNKHKKCIVTRSLRKKFVRKK